MCEWSVVVKTQVGMVVAIAVNEWDGLPWEESKNKDVARLLGEWGNDQGIKMEMISNWMKFRHG